MFRHSFYTQSKASGLSWPQHYISSLARICIAKLFFCILVSFQTWSMFQKVLLYSIIILISQVTGLPSHSNTANHIRLLHQHQIWNFQIPDILKQENIAWSSFSFTQGLYWYIHYAMQVTQCKPQKILLDDTKKLSSHSWQWISKSIAERTALGIYVSFLWILVNGIPPCSSQRSKTV